MNQVGAVYGQDNIVQSALVAFCVVYLPFLVDWQMPLVFAGAPRIYWALDVAKFVIIPGLAIWLMTRFGGVTIASLGLQLARDPGEKRAVVLAATASLLILPIVWLIPKPLPWSYLWSAVHPEFYVTDTISPVGPMHWIGLAYLSLAPAITEEIFFRGVLYRIISNGTTRNGWYVVASALLFASIHWEQGSTVVENAFIYGLIAACIFVRVRSLWPLIAAHFVINLWVFSRM